jgi:glutamyl-tRNA reductase
MEEILVVGTNHRHAPVEWRERIAMTKEDVVTSLHTLAEQLDEVAILSTCNRLEIYAVASHARQTIINWLIHRHGITESEIEKYFYEHADEAAVRHLFTVATGLDSMLVGEAQILGQVCDALQIAQQAKTIGALLSRLFQGALTAGKAARTQTQIGRGALSLGYAAVEQARALFGEVVPQNVLVIGAGEMAESVAGCLAANHIGPIIVANRTFERARTLAEKFGGRAIHFGSIPDALIEADIVIASSAAPHCVVHYEDVLRAMQIRQRPLFLIDIAVPRDIDPRVVEIANVRLDNIDDLRAVCDANLARRQSEADQVRAIIEAEVRRFLEWRAARNSAPVICALYHKAECLRQRELERAWQRLGDLTPTQRAEIELLTQSLVRKILHEPVVHLKQPDNGWHQSDYLEITRALFDLDEGHS